MQDLKDKLIEICDYIPRDKPVVYLDYPIHLNFGDILIMRGTEQFLTDHRYQMVGRASARNVTPRLLQSISPEVTIVLHGGGNFGDLYGLHQNFRHDIIRRFPRNKIVVLPQTVHFKSPQNAAASASIFSAHEDLTLLVRDKPSYEATANVFTSKVFLFPDMAHQLWKPAGTTQDQTERPPLYFLRKDPEAAAVPQALQSELRNTFDWIDFTPRLQQRLYGLILRLHRAEVALGRPLGAQPLWYAYCDSLTRRMTSVFNSHGDVVTSRLHGLIFSTLLSKRVLYLDNTYGKLGSYVDAWLKDLSSVQPFSA